MIGDGVTARRAPSERAGRFEAIARLSLFSVGSGKAWHRRTFQPGTRKPVMATASPYAGDARFPYPPDSESAVFKKILQNFQD